MPPLEGSLTAVDPALESALEYDPKQVDVWSRQRIGCLDSELWMVGDRGEECDQHSKQRHPAHPQL